MKQGMKMLEMIISKAAEINIPRKKFSEQFKL
jgi:hypothetical protein